MKKEPTPFYRGEKAKLGSAKSRGGENIKWGALRWEVYDDQS